MKYKLLELRTYMLEENEELYKMLNEIPKIDEFGQTNKYFGLTKDEIKKCIIENMKNAYSMNLTRNILPIETFVLYVDDKPVCIGGLRLKLNKYWLRHSGNIWYKTRPSEQKKRYCSKFVELICDRAKEFGFREIFAQCDKNNYGSNKVLLNNNFYLYENELCPNYKQTNFYKKEL